MSSSDKVNLADISAYTLKYDDYIIISGRRDTTNYPNPNSYNMPISSNLNNVYKAEMIEVYVPAATDPAVNVSSTNNRLYFSYNSATNGNLTGFVKIQAGTYFNPTSLADELTRELSLAFIGNAFPSTDGIIVAYDSNLNRYNIRDKLGTNTFNIYPNNGYLIPTTTTTVTNSIANFINDQNPNVMNFANTSNVLTGGPVNIITSANNTFTVSTAVPGDYGLVSVTGDPIFSNCILSNIVLTGSRIFLSLGDGDSGLNGNTIHIASTGTSTTLTNLFCQVPNNTEVSSSRVKTLLGQPSVYSSVQFYNPSKNNVNTLFIKWYDEYGLPLKILDHSFTIRLHYIVKNFQGTSLSTPVQNTTTSNAGSIFTAGR